MRQSTWTGNSITRGISPKPLVKRSLLIERKCEQNFKCEGGKNPVLFNLLNLVVAAKEVFEARKRSRLMCVDDGGGGEENKYQRENLVRRFTTLVKCFHCCPSRSSSGFNWACQGGKAGSEAGRGGGLGIIWFLSLSGLNKSIIEPLKGG